MLLKRLQSTVLATLAAIVLVLFSTANLVHEAEHALEGEWAECLLCAHATDPGLALTSTGPELVLSSLPLAMSAVFYDSVSSDLFYHTQHAPRAPPAHTA